MSRMSARFCGSADHPVSRRGFLGTAAAVGAGAFAADMTVLNLLKDPALAGELKKQQKRVILLWLAGGASQLETWDPKPGRPTGGPFRAIKTNVPGVDIGELLPKLAQRMHTTALIRSLNTRNADHGSAAELMHMGRRKEGGVDFPDLCAICARELARADSQVPDYVSMYTATEGRRWGKGFSGFLGARHAPMFLSESMIPENIRRLESISDVDHQAREDLRGLLARRFSRERGSQAVASQNSAYQRVRGLMASERLFDVAQEPATMRAQYGPTQFGEQCLVARRLVEAGVPFVKVGRAWWDSHGQNFETHRELCADLDHVMSALIDDLQDRGLLEHTLLITLGEFGRTPKINASLGRDHFASAWSCSLTGCGIRGGTAFGASDADGQTVADGEIGAGDLFATIFSALGIDPHTEYYVGARPIPITDFGSQPVKDVLA
ncbi:MAG TPA: DUF1501 domain-containing protein [Planctomycetaceae bacterium]|nr:DUF1501 domain-containing protein [Planctomycetaceae bacterium]